MAHEFGTGSVTSQHGKVTARNINTGIMIEGSASDEVLKTALATMQRLRTGDVSGALGVEASEEINVGFHYFDPQAPDRHQFLAELQSLRAELAALTQDADTPAAAADAVESLDEVIAEAQKEQPRAKRIINRLRETIEFISDTGKVLDAAHKAGPIIAQAIPVAVMLYQAAQTLF